jgi:hypothetical protein
MYITCMILCMGDSPKRWSILSTTPWSRCDFGKLEPGSQAGCIRRSLHVKRIMEFTQFHRNSRT